MQESCRGGSPLLQPLTKTFMGIFKRIKRAIATWLLETDSESEDAVQGEPNRLGYRHRDLFLQDEDCPPTSDIEAVNRFVRQKAWERLVGYTGCTTDGKPKPNVVDVDMEALILLEMRMFDRSEDAGVAGNHQWGLDAGMHQDGRYPWSSDGPEGEKDSREGNESELEVGPEFDQEELARWYKVELEKQEEDKQAQKVLQASAEPQMIFRLRRML
ncbi:hypothetical protein ARMSODRAFT_980786 [Armillaria solidipes]|uniref:Uncharacterized protein n=1 Tax=Armillaria solidipes TaxID=1076256 RepID=A0A2H3B5K1_9AGAR|nr:hypothetical protein ARMSODRAFT_980786 [Armillaria solidipes]